MKISQLIVGRVRKSGLTLVSLSLIVLTVLILCWQDLSILANEALQNEATNHIILVPFLASFLIYRRKELSRASLNLEKLKRKSSLISFGEITGIALCLSAFLLYWYGTYTFYPIEFHVVSLTLFVMGITLTLFNVKTLTALIFPILFLTFLAPPPSVITLNAGATLGDFNAQASYTLLKTLGMPVTLSTEYGPPTIIVSSSAQSSMEFSVDQACSGIYSLVAFAMFAAFLILIVRGPITKRIVLISIGFLMLPLLNIIRISLIVSIAYGFGEPIAMTIFHTYSGWLILSIGMLLLLLIAEKLLHLKIYENQSKAASCNACDNSSENNEAFCHSCGKLLENHQTKLDKRFWTKITGLLLATSVVALSIQAPIFAFSQKLTFTSTLPETSAEVFPNVSDYNLNFLYRDTNFERISRTDAALTYAYLPRNVSNPTIFVLVGVGSSISNLHSWEVCLVAWRTAQGMAPVVKVFDQRDVQIMENPPITGRYFVFQYPSDEPLLANYTQVTLYWYQRALFKTGLTVESKYVRISVLILTRNANDYPKHEQRLLDLGQQIATYWEPLKTQSLLSLGIPTLQILLASTLVFAIAMQTTQYASEKRKKTTNLQLFERYGSPEEKRLHQTIKDLRQKTKETTTRNIESAFNHEPINSTKPSGLQGALENLRANRIIQLDVINIQDQPRLVWKP